MITTTLRQWTVRVLNWTIPRLCVRVICDCPNRDSVVPGVATVPLLPSSSTSKYCSSLRQHRYGWFLLEITCSTSCVGIVQNPLTSKNEILSGILAYPNKTSATTQKFVPTTMRLQRRFDRLPILISRTFLNSRLIYRVGNAPELKGPADRP
jgi:hypothetical protein